MSAKKAVFVLTLLSLVPTTSFGMKACDPRLTFTALNLADAKQPVARHEQPNYGQTQLRNECGPPLYEHRR